MESKLLNELASRGCNIAEMLSETFMDNEAFYEKMLKQLPSNTAIERLRAAFGAGDVNGCFEAAHEIKGLSATLGLAPLNHVCCEVVELVRPRLTTEGVGERLVEMERLNSEFCAIISAS